MPTPSLMSVTVTIDGVDVTSYVDPDTLRIEDHLASRIDELTCLLERASSLAVEDWDEIIVTDGATRIFAGYVTDFEEVEGADVDLDIDLGAADYTILLDKQIVKEEYEDQTDKQILSDLFTTYLPEIDAATLVTKVKTHDRVRFNRITLREAVDALAEAAGADWYVDYNKNLHFFLNEDAEAPFNLSDNPDHSSTFPYAGLTKYTDGTGVVNRLEVVGGISLSDDATFILAGNGQDNRIQMPFKMHKQVVESAIIVERNDGTEGTPSWTALTVKVGHIDELGGASEVLHYFQEQVLEQQNAWPNLPNAVRVQSRYEVPLRTRVRDQESFSHYGRYYNDVLVDNDITDKTEAKLRGRGVLAKSAMANVALSLSTREPGLGSGQRVSLTNSRHGLSSEAYIIQGVKTTIGTNGRAVFDVELGTYNPDLIDIIYRLSREAKSRPIWREDEVLDEILLNEESLAMVEVASAPVADQSPYTWAGGANDFNWGFGVWS